MKILKIPFTILKIIVSIILIVILTFNIFNIVSYKILKKDNATFFGYSTAIVVTGSMATEINPNDLVLVKHFEEYDINDIIMFDSGTSFVTHRIIDKTEEGFITKGDANNVEDDWRIKENNIVGKVIFVIPQIGLILNYFKTPLGIFSLILIGFLLYEVPILINKIKEEKLKEEVDEEE